jgi:hypothetical protein
MSRAILSRRATTLEQLAEVSTLTFPGRPNLTQVIEKLVDAIWTEVVRPLLQPGLASFRAKYAAVCVDIRDKIQGRAKSAEEADASAPTTADAPISRIFIGLEGPFELLTNSLLHCDAVAQRLVHWPAMEDPGRGDFFDGERERLVNYLSSHNE